MSRIGNAVKKGKQFVAKIAGAIKKIGKTIKFFISPIGTVVGWILLFVFIAILLVAIGKMIAYTLLELLGINTNYHTFEEDRDYISGELNKASYYQKEVIDPLIESGYSYMVDAENFRDYKAFEYGILMDVAQYLRYNGADPLDMDTEYDQRDVPDDVVYEAIKKSRATNYSVNVRDSCGESYPILGGNRNVKGPYLVYEFRRDKKLTEEAKASGDKTGTNKKSTNPNENAKGSLIPYVYCIKEDIKFTYYFKDDRVIQVPRVLNANLSGIIASTERVNTVAKELEEHGGTILPDQEYESSPIYGSVTQNTVIKIPLMTLVGRYMPRTELLYAWSFLKEDVDDTQIMKDLMENIKGIYNEACLSKDKTSTVTKTNSSGETFNYSKAGNNKENNSQTFVTFKTAGIEHTKYDMERAMVENEIQYIYDFRSAVKISGNVRVRYSNLSGDAEYSVSRSLTKFGSQGNYVEATGDGDGYYPPSAIIQSSDYFMIGVSLEEAEKKIKSQIRSDILAGNPNVDPNSISIGEIKLEPTAVFLYTTEMSDSTLGIKHKRMPILLIGSAKTWAREIKYAHNLVQNPFYPDNFKFIIPNSVTSAGLHLFQSYASKEEYRGKAYYEVFGRMKEKDLVESLTQLENSVEKERSDCYEYMRDMYKLMLASKMYAKSISGDLIHQNTYDYVYLPDSILYYDDSKSQKIYWLDLFSSGPNGDEISREEIEGVRTKRKTLTWQVVDYANYPECNGHVYGLLPFGSAYARSIYDFLDRTGSDVSGNYGLTCNLCTYEKSHGHNGGDYSARSRVGRLLNSNAAALTDSGFKSIYAYQLEKYQSIYGLAQGKQKLNAEIKNEKIKMPLVAIAPGVVDRMEYDQTSGFYVVLRHTSEESKIVTETKYIHMRRWPEVAIGDYVGAGTLLGYEGNTGRSFGSHIHFGVVKDDKLVHPEHIMFPVFNPFYHQGKAEAIGFSKASEYTSLYRTVTMIGDKRAQVTSSELKNQVPDNPLVDNVEDLINTPGIINKDLKIEYGLDWSPSISKGESYAKYLKDKNIYDPYLEEAYFDYNKALEEGYLEVPPELMMLLYGNLIVDVDMAGSIPALSREELVEILNNWIPVRYKEKWKQEFLLNKVFTDDTIDKIIEGQNTYRVSAVFMLAVSTLECQMGLSNTTLCRNAYNIGSITYGTSQPSTRVEGKPFYFQKGRKWNRYENYGDAFLDIAMLIGERGPYFRDGRYTVEAIGQNYCDPPENWIRQVTAICYQILGYYTGSDWTMPLMDGIWLGDNTEFLKAASACVNYLYFYKFGYSFTGGFKPYSSITNGVWGPPKGARVIDCSTYASWVIYEYGRTHNIPELMDFPDSDSGSFQRYAKEIKNGSKSGFRKYLQTVYLSSDPSRRGMSSDYSIEQIREILQPGDILIYRRGTGHVDIFDSWASSSGSSIKKFSCGMAPSKISSYKDGKPYTASMPMSVSKGHGFWDVTAVIRLNASTFETFDELPGEEESGEPSGEPSDEFTENGYTHLDEESGDDEYHYGVDEEFEDNMFEPNGK